MKLRSLLSMVAVAAAMNATAQTAWVNDSVTMGAGYVNDVYYSLQNGTAHTVSNTNWHLGFQMTPQGPYGNVSVIANHVQGGVKVYNMHRSASANFSTISAADTAGLSTQLYNADSSWNYGAFNRTVDPANLYNYSWGTYDQTSHNVNGDSVYLLRIGSSNVAYKFSIKTYVSYPTDSVKWVFRIAQLDNNAGDTTITIRQRDFRNRMFAYYNATTNLVSDREISRFDWDLLFTRYIGMATQGGMTIPYPLTGVLSNFGVTVADVRGVNPDTMRYYGQTFTKNMSEIGSDWKSYNMAANRYDVDTTATFFIRSTNTQAYWQIKFTAFNSATGTSHFSKRYIAPTAVATINNTIAKYYVAPQPANNEVSLMIDTKEATSAAALLLTDLTGRTVYNQPIALNTGLNTYHVPTAALPAGIYVLTVAGQNLKLSHKITVAH